MTRAETVQLLVTCLIDTFFPHVGEAVVNVLTRAGVNVEFPSDQTCCGQPAFNAGLWREARPLAAHTIRVFESARGPVVIPSGSCTAMIRHGYRELFADDPPWLRRAESLAARTYEFSEYLVDILDVTDVGARWQGKLAYHPSCHLLRGLGVERQPLALLAAVEDAEVVALPHAEECCGFGGVFSLAHPEISAEILERKIANLQASAAPTLVVCDTGCLMHIGGGLHRQRQMQHIYHIAEVLSKT